MSFNPSGISISSSSISSLISSIDLNPLIQKLDKVENILIQILNKESGVYMDGNQVGKSLALASSKMG